MPSAKTRKYDEAVRFSITRISSRRRTYSIVFSAVESCSIVNPLKWESMVITISGLLESLWVPSYSGRGMLSTKTKTAVYSFSMPTLDATVRSIISFFTLNICANDSRTLGGSGVVKPLAL